MIRSTMTLALLMLALLGLAHPQRVSASSECIPIEQEDFIDVPGDRGEPGQQSIDTECTDPETDREGSVPTSTVVATLAADPSHGSEWFAIDTKRLTGATLAPHWIAHAVATMPDAPPQVIEIGLQRSGPSDFVVLGRDHTGRTATAPIPLPVISGRYLLLSASKAQVQGRSTLRIGGTRSDAVAWVVPAHAAITLVALAPSGNGTTWIRLGPID